MKLNSFVAQFLRTNGITSYCNMTPEEYQENRRISMDMYRLKLKELNDVTNFDLIKKRLEDASEFGNALGEFEIAAKLRKSGYEFEIIRPTQGEKSPDFKIKIDDTEIYLEVTMLEQAAIAREANKTFSEITQPLLHARLTDGIRPHVRIHKSLSPSHIKEIQDKIKVGIKEAKETGYAHIIEPGVIELVMYPREKENQISQDKKFGIQGPHFHIDQIPRIISKVKQKIKQIPASKLGVLIIFCDYPDLFFFERERFPEIFTNLLEETVYTHQNLIGLCLVSRMCVADINQNQTKETEKYIYIDRVNPEGSHYESVLIIKNRYCKFPVGEKILELFKS